MRILIDTHIFLWLFDGSKRISADVANFLRQTSQNEFYFSAASAWEIAIKYKVGKLKLPDIPERFVPDRMRRAGMLVLPVSMAHALQVSSLPLLHKDPFDRLLVSQAKEENLKILTADPIFAKYRVNVLDINYFQL